LPFQLTRDARSRNNYPRLIYGTLAPAQTLMETTLEIEVKLACDNLGRLLGAGFDLRPVRPRHFEDNWLLDSADQALFAKGAALRVRSVESKGWVTYKGLVRESADSILKIREEIETETSDPERMIQLFERLGFRRAFRYQKYRAIYMLMLDGEEVEVAFDETPMGNFIEIEGDEAQVLRILDAAGFSAQDIIRESYPELQASRCRNAGIPLEDLVFR
jgi:adenylate cyclase, class 2